MAKAKVKAARRPTAVQARTDAREQRSRLVAWAELVERVLRLGDDIRAAAARAVIDAASADNALASLACVRDDLVNGLFPTVETGSE